MVSEILNKAILFINHWINMYTLIQYVVMIMVYKIFGKLEDDKKDANLSLRVSKETRNYFEQHAKSKYGDNATALKDILLRYMETIAYKRGTINHNQVYIILPKISKMENIERDYHTHAAINKIEIANEIKPHKEFISLKNSITPVEVYDYSKDYDSYDELSNQILKDQAYHMGFDENDFIVVYFYLNNHLDTFNNGSYSIGPNNKRGHMGFIMFEFEDVLYHVVLTYVIGDNGLLTNGSARIIYGSDAYKIAKNNDNMELAKFIDKYNPTTSNIEQDIAALKNKKEELQKQIHDINNQLKKIKK